MTQQDILAEWERVSALADGQLHTTEFVRAVELLADSEDARASWHAYHLVGDVLRSGEQAPVGSHDAVFVARLRQRLASEAAAPRFVTPVAGSVEDGRPAWPARNRQGVNESANEASLRWKLVAGFASLTAVAVVGWQVVSGIGAPGEAPQLAQLAVPAAPVAQPAGGDAQPRMIRDPRLDQLLAAHQQFGGTSALQMPAGFLRNATFEQQAR